MSHLSTQKSLSRLGQSCRAWYEVANEELYKRDAKEHASFAIKWMAFHAVDEQTTDSAIRTLETSRQWGGEIDAMQRGLPRSDQDQMLDGDLYRASTALHFAVLIGNVHLTKTLLDIKASLAIPCSILLPQTINSETVIRRVRYFHRVFGDLQFGSAFAFPIFLAFLKYDPDMCKVLIEHGCGREAMVVDPDTDPKVMSILHFAAADPTPDYRQWQCLFDGFREYIDEPCPRESQSTPLHIALTNGCTQGMQIAVESGADKEARDGSARTPLFTGVLGVLTDTRSNPRTFEQRMMCFRKFVELGASVISEGDSLLLHAVRLYAPRAFQCPEMGRLICFLLEHNADIHGTNRSQNTSVVNGISIVQDLVDRHHQEPQAEELLKELLSDLIDNGLSLTSPGPRLPSPLYCVLESDARPGWVLDLLCEKGATIPEYEVSPAFVYWCEIPQLWRTNKYDAWWQHQGQEGEIFQKWCEHPHNVWWWQHVKHISPYAATQAYRTAFEYESRQLYHILTHLPLPAPSDDLFVKIASESFQPWSWRQVVLREFEDEFVATWSSLDRGDNMIHVTIDRYIGGFFHYAAAEAIQDILCLRDKGVDMTCRNASGKTPLDVLLESDRSRDGFMEVAAVLEGKAHKVQELP
ncbi:uncharacterized protein CPUR_05682 [Claviceps purpurea 20.1]|uniref:Uncharacterized protein n=1 Tax=Claviceps purpurea (strain 20.1) TaxID=1111077 RepID=M1VWT4_CLAP2|nr:uncharacterized protein CPUR_05682 [Claviceps purpurea 20.1]